jgi:GntR family transcriptional regulator, transcriptional repressor for pyruvate dehydrogenase complex
MAAFSPVRKTSAHDEIVTQVRKSITDGRLVAGTRLPSERELATEFQVSRATVREAVKTLTSLGLVRVRQGSGTYAEHEGKEAITRSLESLLEVEQTSVDDVLELRFVLEQHMAAKLARQMAPDDFAELDQLAEAINVAATARAAFKAVARFHAQMATSTGNAFLAAISGLLIDLLLEAQVTALPDRPDSFWLARFRRLQPYRLRLVNALRDRDQNRAVAAMTVYHEHLRRGFWPDGTVVLRPTGTSADG